MLFYHIRLRCYVVIELKVVDFKPEFAGKLNFYVAACNKLLRQPEDNPTIGLLLCKSRDQTKVEWAFDSIQNPMGVATYEGIKIKDKLPSVEDLKKRLDMVEQELREYKENEEASAKDGNYTSNQETKWLYYLVFQCFRQFIFVLMLYKLLIINIVYFRGGEVKNR